jgi:hypothetical protein
MEGEVIEEFDATGIVGGNWMYGIFEDRAKVSEEEMEGGEVGSFGPEREKRR